MMGQWDSPEGKPEMVLTRNTGSTLGSSSSRVMAFRSNTLALVLPGHEGDTSQNTGCGALLPALSPTLRANYSMNSRVIPV